MLPACYPLLAALNNSYQLSTAKWSSVKYFTHKEKDATEGLIKSEVKSGKIINGTQMGKNIEINWLFLSGKFVNFNANFSCVGWVFPVPVNASSKYCCWTVYNSNTHSKPILVRRQVVVQRAQRNIKRWLPQLISIGVTFLTLEDLSDAFFQKSVTHSAVFLSPLLSPPSSNQKAQLWLWNMLSHITDFSSVSHTSPCLPPSVFDLISVSHLPVSLCAYLLTARSIPQIRTKENYIYLNLKEMSESDGNHLSEHITGR